MTTAPALLRMRRVLLGLVVAVSASIGAAGDSTLWREEQERFQVGLKLFPACVGALESLQSKRSPDGTLHLLVAYDGNLEAAQEAAQRLLDIGNIRGVPLTIDVLPASALDDMTNALIGGILVAAPDLDGARLKRWSERGGTLVFSAFSGAVEDGAVAGIYVADRILPYINMRQAERAGVRFKPFFLRVARQYD